MSQERIVLTIHLAHDPEAGMWYVASSDIPGLFLEAATPHELISRISRAAPEMIELNYTEILASNAIETSGHALPMSLHPVFDSPMDLARDTRLN